VAGVPSRSGEHLAGWRGGDQTGQVPASLGPAKPDRPAMNTSDRGPAACYSRPPVCPDCRISSQIPEMRPSGAIAALCYQLVAYPGHHVRAPRASYSHSRLRPVQVRSGGHDHGCSCATGWPGQAPAHHQLLARGDQFPDSRGLFCCGPPVHRGRRDRASVRPRHGGRGGTQRSGGHARNLRRDAGGFARAARDRGPCSIARGARPGRARPGRACPRCDAPRRYHDVIGGFPVWPA
jgi:hypothetical protein